MDAARRAAAALLATGLLVGAAGAQGVDEGARPPSKPIPYSQLVHGARPAPRRVAKPRPRARPPATIPAAVPGAPSVDPAAPPASPPIAAPAGTPLPPAPRPAAPLPPPTPAPPRTLAPSVPVAPPPPVPTTLPPPIAAPSARLAPGAPMPAAEVEAFVDAAMAQDLVGGHGVGGAVAVVQNGQVVLLKGYGLADRAGGRRFDGRTGVRLGTASRLLTDLLVLKLAEAGRLDLNAAVDAALPPALKLPAEGFARAPRLGEVLQSRGGFETRTFGRAWLPAARVMPLDEGLRRLRAHRVRDPGGPAIADDYGVALAGAAAAHARGAEFETLAQTDLFTSAGLGSTSFREPRPAVEGLPAPLAPPLAGRLAQGYAWGPHGVQARPYRFAGSLAPALAATTTADDMARLMLLELSAGGGGAAWGPRTQGWLHAGPAPGRPLSGAAYGRLRTRLPGGYAGFGERGAAPGFRVRYLVAPQLGLGVFVAENSEAATTVDTLAPAMVQRFYAGAAPRASGGEAVQPVAGPGLYLDARRAYHGLEGFLDRLHRLVRVRRAAGGGLAIHGLGRSQGWRPTGDGAPLVASDGTELALLGDGRRVEAVAEPGRAAVAEHVGWLHRPTTLVAAAALAAAAALLALGGLFARLGREGARPTGRQTAAAVTQAAAAALWLNALAAFGVFASDGVAPGDPLRPWPDPWLVGASGLAFAAAVLTLVQVVQLPGTWAEGRRFAGWAAGRKLRHTLTVLLFAAFAVVLASWGALEPWSS